MKRLTTMARAAAVLAALILAGNGRAVAQGGPGGGGPNSQQTQMMMQRLGQMLDHVRSQPSAKSMVLRRMRQRMSQMPNARNVDQRISQIGQVIDNTVALSPADYSAQKQQIIHRLMGIIRQGRPPGGPGGSGPGGP